MSPEFLIAAGYENQDEELVGRSWLQAASSWTRAVRGRVMDPFRNGGQPPAPVMVLADNGLWVAQLNEHVRPQVLGVLRRAFTRVSGQQPPDGFDQRQYVTNYLNASVNRMSNIPEEVYREIAKAISDGTPEGESIPNIAARVDQILTVSGSDTWENRSVTVARTEVTGAVNAGTLAAGAQRAITEGRPMVKTWVATVAGTSAGRTRPAHRLADGQAVPITDAFQVGGEPLQYPGDPRGSAGNVINCRCTLSVRAAEETP